MRVDFRLLGDVEVQLDDGLVDVGHARQRCVLVVLLLDANRAVPADQLLDRVWGDRPPRRARNVLSGYLSRLRQVLAHTSEVTIGRQPGGYMLSTDPDRIDVHRFRRLVAEGRAADDVEAAATLLTDALDCWRGAAFPTLDTPWLNGARDVLDAERYGAELDRNDLALAAGRHAELVGELAGQVAVHPLDERLAGQLMLALYRCGRLADALDAYRNVQHLLLEELGADPSPPLRALHQRILSGEAALPVRPAPGGRVREQPDAAVPRQLPAPPRSFIGRSRELAELDALASEPDDRPGAVIVSALSGSGGVGKTTLAVHWAHRNTHRFPDGQLHVNLRGFDPIGAALAPEEALRGFLEALGVHPHRIPDSAAARVGLYRSLLVGRRVLVMIDNARDVQQVRPLLPGAAGCFALVTSRHQLTGLVVADGAVPLPLDLLTHDEARALLADRIGASRAAAEPEAVDQLIDLCARLPLAVAIVAARAAAQRDLPLSALAGQLRNASDRLDALEVGDRTIDIRRVFSWSFAALNPEVARLFRLLGLHPGPEISVPAVASLAGCPVRTARAMLNELTLVNLVTEPSPGRFAFHDLMRVYAAELADTVEPADRKDAALRRILDHYLQNANIADHLLYPHRDVVDLPVALPSTVVEDLSDPGGALEWFTRERQVLLGMARLAMEKGFDDCTWRLAWTMVNYLNRQGDWSEWMEVQERALQAATARGDRYGAAVAGCGMLHAHVQAGRLDEAGRHGRQALALFTELGDVVGQAQTHLALGLTAALEECEATSLAHFLRARELYEAAGHEAGQANALNNAGFAYVLLGHYEQALDLCQRAIVLQHKIGDRYMAGMSWDSLGYAQHHLGDYEAAAASYRTALGFLREQGDRYSEADTLARLGETQHVAGDEGPARRSRRQALKIYEELGHPDLEKLRRKLTADQGQRALKW